MLNPEISQYIIADRTEEARRRAAGARLARQAAADARAARPARKGAGSGSPSRWRAWGWSVTPRACGSARPLPR
jgi:hypothetical protein